MVCPFNALYAMKKSCLYGLVACLCFCTACRETPRNSVWLLEERLAAMVDTLPCMIGIAFVSARDTVTVNNGGHYPMMSVFKLHQSLAVANTLARQGKGFDSVLYIHDTELDRNTWSPMLKKYGEGDLSISVGELLRYALVSSDNNASNLLFKYIASPAETDGFVRSVAVDTSFAIRCSEAEMKQDHSLSGLNYSTPLSAALLIRQVFTSDLVERGMQDSIQAALTAVATGRNRLGAAIADTEGVLFAHKTGSGYRDDSGRLMAYNDVGYFRFPDGSDYSLVVFIRDFAGSEEEASAVIAGISRYVYGWFGDTSMRCR